MGQRILLADPRYVFRTGLRKIFSHEVPDVFIEEAITSASFQESIFTQTYDLIVVNQIFLTEISHIVEGNMVVLAEQPDKEIFLAVREHHARAYLNDDPSEHLLQQVLHLKVGEFLIEPAFSYWIIEQIGKNGKLRMQMDLLTAKEREIAELLNKELSYQEIADRLFIAESTVRRHVANIRCKLRQRN